MEMDGGSGVIPELDSGFLSSSVCGMAKECSIVPRPTAPLVFRVERGFWCPWGAAGVAGALCCSERLPLAHFLAGLLECGLGVLAGCGCRAAPGDGAAPCPGVV